MVFKLFFRPFRLTIPAILLVVVGACSSLTQNVFNPDKGRIIHENSAAVVGPLLDASQQDAVILEKENLTQDKTLPKQNQSAQKGLESEQEEQKVSISKEKAIATKTQHKSKEEGELNKAPTQTKGALVKEKPAVKALPQKNIVKGSTVKGNVKFLDAEGAAVSTQGSIVILRPLTSKNFVDNKSEPKSHVIDMENKVYTPRFVSISKNDSLVFVNKDEIKHNVFSSSGKNAFDLGTYGAGKKRTVSLGETGIVKVYCNIHPQMATFISVNDDAISVIADENGYFEIADVPGGEYEMHVWHIRGERKMTIQVSEKAENYYSINVDTVAVSVEKHKNKFGKDYTKNSALFDDEFY